MANRELERKRRWTIRGIAGHSALLSLAIALYPGGTYWNKSQRGFSLRNFWCDLLAERSHSGDDNSLGSWLTRLALLTLALVFPVFTSLLADDYVKGPAWRLALGTLATLGALGLGIVALTTGLFDRRIHDWAILLLGPCGLLSLIGGLAVSVGKGGRAVRVAGCCLVVFATWNMVQYARQTLLDSSDWAGLPVVQKVATVSLLAWMLAVSRARPQS